MLSGIQRMKQVVTSTPLALHLQWKAFAGYSMQAVYGAVFILCLAAALILDAVMVLHWRVESISARCWDACSAHPNIAGFGLLFAFLIILAVRESWVLVMLAALMAGHLFMH
jgi:hypothetical protein